MSQGLLFKNELLSKSKLFGSGGKYDIGDIVPAGQIIQTPKIPITLISVVSYPIISDSQGNYYFCDNASYFVKINADGTQAYRVYIGNNYYMTDMCFGLDGNIYSIYINNGAYFFKTNPTTGVTTIINITIPSGSSGYYPICIAYSSDGNLLVGLGNGHVLKYGYTGGAYIKDLYLGNAAAVVNIATDTINNQYFCINSSGYIYKLDSSLSTSTLIVNTAKTVNLSQGGKNFVIDSQNNFYFISAASIYKYSNNGTLVWSKTYINYGLTSLNIDNNHLTFSYGTSATSPNIVVKLDLNGNQVWIYESVYQNGAYPINSINNKVLCMDNSLTSWCIIPSTYTVIS